MTSTPASTPLRRLLLVTAVLMAVIGATAASASAAKIRGTYAVNSIVITMNSSVTTTAAVLGDGTTGTLTTTLKTTLRSKKPGRAMGIQSPEIANQFICSPMCPSFTVGGTVSFTETFVPASGGAATACRTTRTLPVATKGTVYVTSDKTGARTLVFKIADIKGPNDLYVLLRGSCALPNLPPVDSYDYSGFGTRSLPTSKLGTKTITLRFANTLKPPSYPWPAKGTTKMTATAVLVRTR